MVFVLPQQSLTKNQRNTSMVPVAKREQDFKLTALTESVAELQTPTQQTQMRGSRFQSGTISTLCAAGIPVIDLRRNQRVA